MDEPECEAPLNTTLSLVVIAAMLLDIYAIYSLRRQGGRVILGVGGSILLLGFIVLATLSGFISGYPGLILVIALLIVYSVSFYSIVRTRPGKHGSSPEATPVG
jgi:hypothetical protein